MKVLIVEDDENLAILLQKFVERAATHVVVARTIQEAMVEIDKANDFDLVTLDLTLPDSMINDTISRIREIKQKKPNALVIVITGASEPNVEKLSLEGGADGVIFKQSKEFLSRGGFMEKLKMIVDSIIAQPKGYQRNVAVLEKVAERISLGFNEASR